MEGLEGAERRVIVGSVPVGPGVKRSGQKQDLWENFGKEM